MSTISTRTLTQMSNLSYLSRQLIGNDNYGRTQRKRRQTKLTDWSAQSEASQSSKSSKSTELRRLEARARSYCGIASLSAKQRLVMVESQHEMSEKAQNKLCNFGRISLRIASPN